jgi:small subunit ribosomal protein S1
MTHPSDGSLRPDPSDQTPTDEPDAAAPAGESGRREEQAADAGAAAEADVEAATESASIEPPGSKSEAPERDDDDATPMGTRAHGTVSSGAGEGEAQGVVAEVAGESEDPAPASTAAERDDDTATTTEDAVTVPREPVTASEAATAASEATTTAPEDSPTTTEGSVTAAQNTAAADTAAAAGDSATPAEEASAETDGTAAAAADSPPPVPSEQLAAFNALMEAFDKRQPVEGKVIGWNKGGFHVSLDGVPGFCPKSQIEIGNPKKASNYVGRDLHFKILEVRDGGKRIVLSRTDMLKEERQRLLNEVVVPGNTLEGTVSNLTDFGAFVDVGGVEGLVHLSKLSRRRVEHPRELLQVGDRVKVRVLRVEKNGKRISLSMKELEPDPWDSAGERYPVGSQVEGKILRAAEFGLFVEVEPGLEGLVHTSQLPLGKELGDPSLAEGSPATCWVRSVDGSRRRLSLAMREVATRDPWSGLTERYPEGAVVEGRVEQVAKFGLFVELEPGLTGLLPYSAMSMPEGSRPERTYGAGQPIVVQVAGIDFKRRRISLAPKGKQLEGTKADYREYQNKQKQRTAGGLNALAAAFAKLDDEARDQA